MEPQYTVHEPVWIQFYGRLQSQRKGFVRMGQSQPAHLFPHLELNHFLLVILNILIALNLIKVNFV